MTNFAQYLNVIRIGAKCWGGAVRFGMMALKIFNDPTFFAASTLRYNLCNCFSAGIRALTGAIIPFWMIRSSHVFASLGCSTSHRTVFAGAATTFADLKLFSTFFASTLQQSFGFVRFQFVRALFGARMSNTANVSIWSSKYFSTRGAHQGGVSTPINCSLEFCHG